MLSHSRAFTFILLTLVYVTSLANELPSLGDPTRQTLSPFDEYIMGKRFYQSLRANVPFINDLIINDYLSTLGQKLVSYTDASDKEFHFFVIKVPTINAFAGPDGYIGIQSGLYLAAKDESELAGVMAHEISHVTQRHLARAMTENSTSPATVFAAILAGIILGAQDPAVGAAIMYGGAAAMVQSQINFTRANEYEADRIGIGLLKNSGINPEGMADFFETLLQKAESDNELARMEFLRTHPLSTTRIAEARARIRPEDRKLPSDSLNFELSKARLSVLASDSLDRLINQYEHRAGQNHNLVNDYALASAYIAIDQPDRAIPVLKKLIAEKKHPWFEITLAEAYEKKGNLKQAIDVLQNLENIYPNYLPVSVTLARLLNQTDQYKQAITILKQLLRYKKHPLVYQQLAQAYYSQGNIALALEATSYQYELDGYLKLAAQQIDNALKQPNLDNSTRQRFISRKLELQQQVQFENQNHN